MSFVDSAGADHPLGVAYKMLGLWLSRAAKSILGSAPNCEFSSNFASFNG
jgi:hypothetical protein